MSTADTLERKTLFKSDKEIAACLGVSYDLWLDTAKKLEKRGLPPKDPEFARKRYWPAVRAFLDRRAGVGAPLAPKRIGGNFT